MQRRPALKRFALEAITTAVWIGLSDLSIVLPSKNYGVVEDIHLILEHAISQDMKRAIQNAQG